MQKKGSILFAGVCAAVLAGCTNVATFDYAVAHGTM